MPKGSPSTTHSSGTNANNSIDFFLWNTADNLNTLGSKHVMTLEGTGNVGIGTTSPQYTLDVKSTGTGIIARFNSNNTTGCTLATGGTITCTSDQRLKENILTTTYGLNTLMQLNPIEFDWKQDIKEHKQLGFIAQEVEGILPTLVATDTENGNKLLNTNGLIPVITKAIQELNIKLDSVLGTDLQSILEEIEYSYQQTQNFMSTLGLSEGTGGDLLIDNNVNITGLANLNDVTIAGDFSVGSVSIDSLSNSINILGPSCGSNNDICVAQTLYIQKNISGNIDILDGKVVIDTNGNLTTQGTVSANKVEAVEVVADGIVADEVVSGGIVADEVVSGGYMVSGASQTIGSGTIVAGETYVDILSNAVKNDSKIFVNSTSIDLYQALNVTEKNEGTSFRVNVKVPLETNIEFDWFIVNIK